MVKTCESCGRPIPELDVMVELTKHQGKILLILDKAGRAGLSIRSVVDRLYGNDPEGGPINAVGSIRVMRAKMQPVLEKHGMRIASVGGGIWRLDVHK